MIDLRTGVPGACKTLSAVEALDKMLKRWEKHPDEARPIFVHGVKDLALPHAKLPLVPWIEGEGTQKPKPAVMVPDWATIPDGAYCLIDEAQDLFPPRSSGADVPPHIAWLNTHRHRGFDITVITQHPKLINAGMRALIGKHQHFRRMFGRQVAICYEWDACSDNLSGMATAVTSKYVFPKRAFEWYKSAEVHTKQSFRLPKWLLVPVIGVAASAFAFPYAVSKVTGLGSQDKAKAAISSAGGSKTPTAGAPAHTVVVAASLPGAPFAAGPASGASAPAAPVVAGCMATPTRCLCVDAQGIAAKVSEAECRVASVSLGGLIPYDTEGRTKIAAPRVNAPAEPPQTLAGGVVSIGGGQAYRGY